MMAKGLQNQAVGGSVGNRARRIDDMTATISNNVIRALS
jgi:hypothetical protein